MTEARETRVRTARCGCGQLTVRACGEPVGVYACSCLSCQRASGSAFSYSALYPEAAVAVAGARNLWRRRGESGRWTETEFCPTCGVTLCFRNDAYPAIVGIAAGAFADPDFAPPERVYWASRRHRWLAFPEGVERLATQGE